MAPKLKKESNESTEKNEEEILDTKDTKVDKKAKKNKKEKRNRKDKENKKEKNNKKEKVSKNDDNPDKKESSILRKVITIGIILVLLASLAAAIAFNLFNIRAGFLTPMLRNIPIINNLIPESNSEEQLSGLSNAELIRRIESLTNELDSTEIELNELNNVIQTNENELIRLREIESQQLEFREEKNRFDEMIALNDPNAYIEFFERIYPENAEMLYQQAVLSEAEQADIKRYVANFRDMDENSAAAILEQLISTDMDLVVLILKNINSSLSAAILAEMSPQNAASVAKIMAP